MVFSIHLPLSGKDGIMRDEYDDRLRLDGRAQINNGIDRLLARIMQAFRVLHTIHWSSPWAVHERRCRN
ncbi:hypothetical protein V473_06775 [Sphingobium cupriresistens LL01]|uniref:Uncharacterized protein n=2 Tax=Sphingomonadaceae TaxID=41297 RepID=A0A0J7Y4B0_9SPHN|nr:hypothetical protein V473_06775 [Sphingobium cupriresistens LL01]